MRRGAPIFERIAEIPWRVQRLPDEDAFEHRVRVVREVLAAKQRVEDENQSGGQGAPPT